MKRVLLFLMVIATLALSSSAATKIYVCGTKITGTTSFSAAGGSVSYNNSTRELILNNVNYSKSGSSNNGISVDEVDGDLSIYLNGTVSFTIYDADAVLCKDKNKHATYIYINGNSTFLSVSSGHAGLKLQDCDVYLKGSGSLTIKNTNSSSSANAIKGGTCNEYLDFGIKNCTVESNGPRLYNLNEVYFHSSSYFDSGDYSSRSTTITFKPGNNNTLHASNVNSISGTKIFLPINYYDESCSNLRQTLLAGKEVQLSNYTPAVVINANKFPDVNLLSHMLYLEPQGWLTTSAMNAYTYMNLSSLNISNMQGLSQFTHLIELICNNNNLTNLYGLPTSSIQVLNCSNNKITSFNYLQNCSSLKTLNCSNNQISSLDNLPTNIESLDCSSNKFTSLNFDYMSNGYHYGTKYTKLSSLKCSNNTQLTELYHNYDGGNIAALTTLDVSGCTSLTKIHCPYNKISSLSSLPSSLKTLNLLSNQLTSLPSLPSGLELLQVTNNKLTSFTYSNSSTIKSVYIGGNPITTATVTNNSNLTFLAFWETPSLTTLNCYGNSSLKFIEFDGYSTGVKTLDCHSCALTVIHYLEYCTALTKIICNDNQLTSLDVSNLSNLIELNCNWNKIGSLNLSNKTKLTSLNAGYNQLTSLNVQGCSSLNYLYLQSNKLSSLSVQGCNALRTIDCCLNKINASGANTLINSLCTIPAGSQGVLRYIYPGYSSGPYVENNVSLTDTQVRSARNKRWIPYKFTGSGWVEIPVSATIPGDVNGDGSVNSADVTALYDYLLNNDSSGIVNGDVDGDGHITSGDITAVYDILLGS